MRRERGVRFMIFALCGGDGRALRLAAQLLGDGHAVRAWALDDAGLPEGVRRCRTAAECVSDADCVVLPLPAVKQRGFLNAPLSARPRCLAALAAALPEGALVCAGNVTRELRELCEARAARLRDYAALESFRAENSLATAEGAIGVLLGETEGVLCGMSALIIGAGRITRALAPRLAALGLRVTVASRSEASRAWARAAGLSAAPSDALTPVLPGAELVINTAPALVLTAPRLTALPDGALVLDLASAPGGVDLDAARAFGIRCAAAPGLPGKWSPEAAAGAVRRAVYQIMEAEK